MKKKIISSLLLSGMVLFGISQHTTVFAAPVSTTTEGKVKFIPNDGGSGENPGPIELIKPGTNDQIITMADGQGKGMNGGIRIAFVPNIDFGEAQVSVMEKSYPAKMIKYKFNEGADQSEKFIPPFIQVIDERGSDKGFKVEVAATQFTTGTEEAGHTLLGTKIQVKGSKLTNQSSDKTGGPAVDTLLTAIQNDKSISTDAQVLMTTKEGAGVGPATNNAASSLVFDSEYAKDKVYGATDVTQSLKLVVPQGDQPQADKTYTSTITWTLTDTK